MTDSVDQTREQHITGHAAVCENKQDAAGFCNMHFHSFTTVR